MARETLPVALDLMFGHEGGYVNAKTDRGGPTKYGVTHKTLAAHLGVPSVTADRVKAMTRAEAEAIYRRSYWAQAGGDVLPAGLDYAAFDFGVNSGPSRAVKSLQSVLASKGGYKGKIDGHIGEQTIAAVASYPGGVRILIVDYCDERMRFLRSLTNPQTGFPVNGRGWTIRVTGKDPLGKYKTQPGVVGNALKLAAAKPTAPTETPPEATAKAEQADRGVVDIVKKEPSLLVSLLSGVGALAAGSGPVQWALAIAVVAGVGYGIYRLVKRERADA